jgi:ribonuclease HI
MYFDGSKRVEGAGARVVLISLQGDKMKYVLQMSFPNGSNNKAEYEALLHGMQMAKACGTTRLKIFGDSNLAAQKVMNLCDALSDNIAAYRNLYYYLEGTFDGCEVSHISRASNKEAKTLANIGSQCLPIPARVFWEEITEMSIKNNKPLNPTKNKEQLAADLGSQPEKEELDDVAKVKEVMMLEVTWMQLYLAYLINKKLPDDGVEA